MTQKKDQLRVPLIFKLLLPLIAGVIVSFYSGIQISAKSVWVCLSCLGLLTLPILSKRLSLRAFYGVITMFFFFFLGLHLAGINKSRNNEYYFYSQFDQWNNLYQVQVAECPELKKNSVKCFANVLAVNGQKKMGRTLLYFEKSPDAEALEYGDVICFSGHFNPARPNGNPKEFDYSRYLKIHDVNHQAYVQKENWETVGNKGSTFFKWVFKIRSYLDNMLDKSGLEGANLMVARALILGEKESLDRETLRTYSSAGAMHVLAVSGLHVGIVMLIFSFLLKPLKRLPKGRLIFVVLLVLIIWCYALITGMSSSVLRATVMFSFVIIGKELERDTSIYQSIMVSAFLLIIIEPLVIFQVGFQLSYLAVLGIVFLQPKIYNLFYSRYFLIDKVWQITSVSIAAQVATFPLGLYYFHQFPNFFMISNLIVIPLAFAILIVGIAYFLVAWIPIIESIVYAIFEFLLTVLNSGVKWVEQLPYSIYWGVSIHWYEVFWLYLIILLGAGAFILRKAKLLMTALALSAGLLLFNISEKYFLESTNQLVIYNVNNSMGIDLFYGRQNIFIADQALVEDEDKLLFHVKHNWFYRSGNEEAYQTIVPDSTNSMIRFGDKTLLLLNETNLSRVPKVDIVYLQNMNYLDEVLVQDFIERNTTVIIGSKVGYKLTQYLQRKIDPDLLHELRTEGAFIRTF